MLIKYIIYFLISHSNLSFDTEQVQNGLCSKTV
jgi:hypothetical protein